MATYKRLTILAVVTILLTLAGVSARAQVRIPAQLPDLKGREVKVVSSNDYTPFTFIDPLTSKTVGYEYELIKEICWRLNCFITPQSGEWPALLVAVSQGQYDVGMVGISITDERKQQVDFSDPYIVVDSRFLVRADESRFKDSASFKANPDLKIGTQAGTTGQFVSEGLLGEKNERIKFYDNFGIAVQALLKGDVDAVVSDVAAGRGYIGVNEGKLKLLDESLATDPIGLIFKKGSDLVAPFNQAIASMKADGYLNYLENKWFFLFDPNAKPEDTSSAASTQAPTMEATAAQ